MATKTQSLSLFESRPKDLRQGSRKRGYDSRWEKLRDRFIAENPICKHCQERGYVNPASEVDHVKPFNGLYDPLRLSWENLQSLCHSCHVTKTNRDQKGG